MEIIRGTPKARGVTELMVVGSDEVEGALQPTPAWKRVLFAVGAIGLWHDAKGQSGRFFTRGTSVYLAIRALLG